MKIPVVQAVSDKRTALRALAEKEGFPLSRTLFVGNDVNDLGAMESCALSACPSDSHKKVQALATYKLHSKGGEGVVRELVEVILETEM